MIYFYTVDVQYNAKLRCLIDVNIDGRTHPTPVRKEGS